MKFLVWRFSRPYGPQPRRDHADLPSQPPCLGLDIKRCGEGPRTSFDELWNLPSFLPLLPYEPRQHLLPRIADQTLDLRTLKPLDRTTAVVEIWDLGLLVAEVFAREDGERRFHLSTKAALWGPHWKTLGNLAAEVTKLLDVADEEMRLARHAPGGR